MSADPYEENHRKRRRNRMRVSCLNCYASKRKCDRKRPCSRCTKHGLTGLCVYELDDPDARDPSLDEKTHLRNRIAELESVIRELNNRPHPRWFTSSGTEHLPELVAVRRSSTTSINTDVSNTTVTTSIASMDSNPTPRKASLRARTLSSSFKSQEERVSGKVKTGMKRKFQDDGSMETRTTSLPSVNAFFTSKNRSKGSRSGNAGRKGYHSDVSYLTDDDDDDYIDDEDYEEKGSHSRFKNTHRRSRGPAKRVPGPSERVQRIGKNAYTFPSRRISSLHDSHNDASPKSVTIASSGPASRSPSVSGLFSSHSHKDDSNAADDSPLSVITHLLPIGQCQDHTAANTTNCQSALGLTFDGTDSYSNARPQDGDEDDIDEPEPRHFSLRQNVVWSDGDEEDCNTIVDKNTPAPAPVIKNPSNKRIVKLTLKAKEKKPQKPSKKKLPNKKVACDDGSSVKHLDNAEDKIPASSTLCSHLAGATNRNDLESFIKALGDTSDMLRLAHVASKDNHQHDTKIECDLFKRITGLDDFICSIGSVHRTQTDEHPLSNVVIPNAIITKDDKDLSHRLPGARIGGHALPDVKTQNESSPSPPTSLIIAPLPDSASAMNKKSSKNRRRQKRLRTSVEESSKSSTTATVVPPPDSTTKIPNIPTAPLSPAPTPAYILARSALQQHKPKVEAVVGLPSTVTLATILAATLGTGPPPPPQQLTTTTTPPRLISTPGPTLLPTPTFSPSSPLLRSVNSAIRRPDADFLPFYSNHQFNVGENDAAEREYHTHSRTLMGSFIHRPSAPSLTRRKQQQQQQDHPTHSSTEPDSVSTAIPPLDAFTFSPLLNLDTSKIGEVKNPSSTVIIPVVVPNTRVPNGNMAGEEEMELDVDAEGEPAPESGYEYGYFDDGYRYECVWVGET